MNDEEKLMLAMSALTEIWSCHMENDSGNLTEILTHYKETMALDIPEGGEMTERRSSGLPPQTSPNDRKEIMISSINTYYHDHGSDNTRIAQDAQDAFWAVVADNHPEITRGDFPWDVNLAFSLACDNAVAQWVKLNQDDPSEEE